MEPSVRNGPIAAGIGECKVEDARGNSFAVSASRFANNLALLRQRLNAGTEVWQVAKGDGYGLGIDVAAWLGKVAGVDGYCVGTHAEARRLRDVAPSARILVFTCCPPAQLPEVADLGVIVTVNSREAFDALARRTSPSRFMFELDCGFGRYGLDEEWLIKLWARLESFTHLDWVGTYTHFGMAAEELLREGMGQFDTALEKVGGCASGLITMLASSESIMKRPKLPYTAVDPGRLLYGLVGLGDPDWEGISPVVERATSTISQVNCYPETRDRRIGYGSATQVGAGTKTAVFPLGWRDGLSATAPYGSVIIKGQPCQVLARTLLHSIVDISHVDAPTVGDEVVIFDNSGRLPIGAAAAAQGQTALWMHMQLLSSISRFWQTDGLFSSAVVDDLSRTQ